MTDKTIKTHKAPAPFEFPQEAATAVTSANTTTVGLPFDTYVWFVKNGRPAAKASGGVEYTGGFASSSIPDAAYQVVDVEGTTHDLTKIFAPLTISNLNTQGQAYDTVDMVQLIVTPVVYRKRYFEGRSHAQVLCLQQMPGTKTEAGVVAWAMLSARGYQSSILLEEIGKVASNTSTARRELGNPPVNFFWHRIGMPTNPEFKPVGKGATSIITPVHAALAVEDLRECYIGNDLATLIGEAVKMEEVILWRDAWKEEQKSTPFGNGDNADNRTGKFENVPF